jgi:hypothetical protein
MTLKIVVISKFGYIEISKRKEIINGFLRRIDHYALKKIRNEGFDFLTF